MTVTLEYKKLKLVHHYFQRFPYAARRLLFFDHFIKICPFLFCYKVVLIRAWSCVQYVDI